MAALSTVSTTTTIRPEVQAPHIVSQARKWVILAIACIAQFVDVYSASAVVLGIPDISSDLSMGATESTWTINAYAITLASFMLAAGKLSDLVSAKWVFCGGLAWVGVFSLGIGFSNDKVTFFVLRAVKGIGAACCIPSALHIIVHLFPREHEQHVALSAFGASGEVANVLGFILGGALLQINWQWIFWLLAPICIPLAVLAALLIPTDKELKTMHYDVLNYDTQQGDKRAGVLLNELESLTHPTAFDYVGTFLLLAASVLTIFGLTDGSEGGGWARAQPIVTLVIGVLLFPAFFYYETRIDLVNALIDPTIWRIKNVTPLILVALTPYFWWYAAQFNWSTIMESDWGVSSIMTAVRFLPISVGGGAVFLLVIFFPSWPSLKTRLLVGSVLASGGSIMLVYARDQSWYWPLVVPGFVVGSLGTALVFITVNNAAMAAAPSQHAGVVGGVLNATYQLGAATGLSIIGSLKAQYITGEDHSNIPWKGYQVTFWFMAAVSIATGLLVLFAYREGSQLADTIAFNARAEEADEHERRQAKDVGAPPPPPL